MKHSPDIAAVLLLLSSASALAGDFKVLRTERDGLVLESRRLPESDFPASLAEAAWTFRRTGVEGKLVERRQVLQETPSSRLVWQVIRPPVVARRESLIRFSREHQSSGAFVVQFHSEDGAMPEHLDDAVRVGLVRGSWKFVPDGAGGAFVEHVVLSEPGGGVPPWLAVGTQENLALDMVREVLAQARGH
jgi:hypothetical protein